METSKTDAPKQEFVVSGGYDIKETLADVGGQYMPSSKTWVLSQEAYDDLWERVCVSRKRSNKRDRHLATTYDRLDEAGKIEVRNV